MALAVNVRLPPWLIMYSLTQSFPSPTIRLTINSDGLSG